jgi:hypothetical protein
MKPPGWPDAVRPPGTPDWERTAVAWLLDQAPPDYRSYPVLARHPVALAWLTGHHVEAGLQAVRRARGTSRSDLGENLSPPVLEEVLRAVDAEEARLLAARRAVALLGAALRGERHVPRL